MTKAKTEYKLCNWKSKSVIYNSAKQSDNVKDMSHEDAW